MRDGRIDEDLRGWSVEQLHKRGLDGRGNVSIKQKAEALLAAVQEVTIYVEDPGGAEWIQRPHVTLCLRNKCIPGGDCDDLTGALGGAMLSIAVPSYAVKVTYPDKGDGTPRQEHILNGIIDEDGKRWYADASSKRPLMDHVPFAVEEEWVDPLDMTSSVTGTTGAELAMLGASMKHRDTYYKGGHWFEFAHGRWWMHDGTRWIEGPRDAQASGLPGLGKPVARDGRWWVRRGNVDVELTSKQAHEAGLGEIFGFHTVHELSNLIDALQFQVARLEDAALAGQTQWVAADPQAANAWAGDLQKVLVAWVPVINMAQAVVASVSRNDWDHTLALDGVHDAFKEVTDAYHPFVALDRTLRATPGFPKDKLPDYTGTPQPDAPDLDLALYQIADNGVQKVEQFGRKLQDAMETASPWIALAAAGLGLYALSRIPRRRSA